VVTHGEGARRLGSSSDRSWSGTAVVEFHLRLWARRAGPRTSPPILRRAAAALRPAAQPLQMGREHFHRRHAVNPGFHHGSTRTAVMVVHVEVPDRAATGRGPHARHARCVNAVFEMVMEAECGSISNRRSPLCLWIKTNRAG
jgi:hypothetical protein